MFWLLVDKSAGLPVLYCATLKNNVIDEYSISFIVREHTEAYMALQRVFILTISMMGI